jgi:hypothetical protein
MIPNFGERLCIRPLPADEIGVAKIELKEGDGDETCALATDRLWRADWGWAEL